jgi:hypothetical protein
MERKTQKPQDEQNDSNGPEHSNVDYSSLIAIQLHPGCLRINTWRVISAASLQKSRATRSGAHIAG